MKHTAPYPSEDETSEESLDPADWDQMRDLGRRMVDDIMRYLQTVRDRPLWQPIPSEVKAFFRQPLPRQSQGAEGVYRDFKKYVLPYPMGTIHPRFWAWVIGTGTPLGALAEMLAAAMNPNLGGAEHVANYVEHQVIDWCKHMLGYPAEASGLLVRGGSMANLIGLTVARNSMAEHDVRRLGVAAAPRPMTLYGSSEMHSSVQKAVELLGLGSDALRKIAVDSAYRIDTDALATAVARDRKAGFLPFCLIGNAGTVNTGAFDDLKHLGHIAMREKMWFHVDGAFGSLAALCPELNPLTRGLQSADSLAFDLHKWMYMPIEVGCALVRREQNHRQAFSLTPEYLTHGGDRGLMAGARWFSDYGLQLSRGFRALKVWMSIKEHGIEKYARLIRQNVRQASDLSTRIDQDPQLEMLAPAPLNIVCFRFKARGLDDDELDRVNEELLIRLHESGTAAPSYTTLNGRYAIRVAITNHRSRREDFDVLLRQIKRIGLEIVDGPRKTN
jgi:glutamate/tyrosine decarboxylase-like PLP-dependent enzyme